MKSPRATVLDVELEALAGLFGLSILDELADVVPFETVGVLHDAARRGPSLHWVAVASPHDKAIQNATTTRTQTSSDHIAMAKDQVIIRGRRSVETKNAEAKKESDRYKDTQPHT